jgi:hypothetical protein
MQHWVAIPHGIRGWLHLVVGIPDVHASAVQELARTSWEAARASLTCPDKDGVCVCREKLEELPQWWQTLRLESKLESRYLVLIEAAIQESRWHPCVEQIRSWSRAKVTLWYQVVTGCSYEDACAFVGMFGEGVTGTSLLDLSNASRFAATHPAHSRISAQDFSLPTIPCLEFDITMVVCEAGWVWVYVKL